MYQTKPFDFSVHGAFFAFWNDQFNEKKVEGVKYEQGSLWLIAPKGTLLKIMELFHEHNIHEAKERIRVDGIEKIIIHEFGNYECGYTGEIEPLGFLTEEPYNCTREFIKEVIRNRPRNDEE